MIHSDIFKSHIKKAGMRRCFIIAPNYRAALHQPGNNESLIQQPLGLRNY